MIMIQEVTESFGAFFLCNCKCPSGLFPLFNIMLLFCRFVYLHSCFPRSWGERGIRSKAIICTATNRDNNILHKQTLTVGGTCSSFCNVIGNSTQFLRLLPEVAIAVVVLYISKYENT